MNFLFFFIFLFFNYSLAMEHIILENGKYATVNEIILNDKIKYEFDLYSKEHFCGRCLSIISKEKGHILTVEIGEEYQGKGYGSEFFKLVCKFLISKECKSISWTAAPLKKYSSQEQHFNNLNRLIKFYKKHGGEVLFESPYGWASMQLSEKYFKGN